MGKAKKQKSQLVKVKGTSDRQPVSQKAFKVSQHKATKAKHKAKVVSTNLKRVSTAQVLSAMMLSSRSKGFGV